ncbi:MAG TPA: saccharopine dehydrogenase C-terminal domain-containing protein [Saprospiraceae bacterium]|nr:saccharopine dehydrogenase C-terminal domain-containing protein [Saprospiraceae bacterium]
MSLSQNIVVAGAGGIGSAVGLMLANYPEFRGDIYLGDRNLKVAQQAASWIREGTSLPIDIVAFEFAPELNSAMQEIFSKSSLILDCLPGKEAPRLARIALQYKMHYANLTEYVQETNEIIAMARDAETGFVLQTGLAPGFVNVLATKLYGEFRDKHGVTQVEYIGMRVGGLTAYAISPHYYGFTWSPIGVTTEYVKPCMVVRKHQKQSKAPLSERENLILHGVEYEADLTSGGAADIPDTYAKYAKNVDYKTIRYPGHFAWIESLLGGIQSEQNLPLALYREMSKTVPMVEDDIIVIYAFVSGYDTQGILHRIESAYRVMPRYINGKKLRAIQATTAAPMAECARLLLEGKWKGIILQSQVDPQSFFNGPFIESVYQKSTLRNSVPIM